MDYKHTIDILSENLKEIANIIDGFAENQRIPALDLDLVLAKTRNLYDVLLMLKKYAIEDTVPDKKEKIVANPKKIESDKKLDDVSTKNNDTIAKQNTLSDKPASQTDNEFDKKEETDTPKTLSDRFKKQSVSLHDNLIQSKSYYDLSAKLQSKPLTNINNAIGINDRFSFIQELFKGDADKYNETMEILNNASDFNEAYNYIIENHQWDMNSDSVQKILELIRRKFITAKDE